MIKVNVIIKYDPWLKYIKSPKSYLKNKLKKIQEEKIFQKKKYNFSLLLTNETDIKKFNKKFRNKNKATDVLSFPYQNKKDIKKLISEAKEIYLGDIIINYKKMDASSNKLFKKKFNLMWIHGLLHLLGYDHIKDSHYKKMYAIEKKLLKKIN